MTLGVLYADLHELFLDWYAAHTFGWTPDQRRSVGLRDFAALRAIERAHGAANRYIQEEAVKDAWTQGPD